MYFSSLSVFSFFEEYVFNKVTRNRSQYHKAASKHQSSDQLVIHEDATSHLVDEEEYLLILALQFLFGVRLLGPVTCDQAGQTPLTVMTPLVSMEKMSVILFQNWYEQMLGEQCPGKFSL